MRPESREVVREFKEVGTEVYMLTGDDDEAVELVGRELGIDKYFSRVLPEDKAEIIRRIRESGNKVAMVGD